MYRVLRATDAVHERRPQARHPAMVKPELVASGPNSAGVQLAGIYSPAHHRVQNVGDEEVNEQAPK